MDSSYMFAIASITALVSVIMLSNDNKPAIPVVNQQPILVVEQGINCTSRFEDKQLIITCNKTK